MVAIRLPQTDPGDWAYAPGPTRPVRPQPTRRPSVAPRPGPDRATRYRRRRLAALVVSTLVVASLVAAVGYLTSFAGPGGAPASVDARPGEAYLVQPGDTLWSIAASLAPGDDPRPIVDRLREANGGSTLQAGDRLVFDVD
jgi:Tfp pilus assembly protein FimV